MPPAKYALLRRVRGLVTPHRRARFIDPPEGECLEVPPAGLRGGRSFGEWRRMTPAEREEILDREAPLDAHPRALLQVAWRAFTPEPAPLTDAEELARLTDPATRRLVIRGHAPPPQPFYRAHLPRDVWKVLSKSQRRAVLDQTAPMPALSDDQEVLP